MTSILLKNNAKFTLDIKSTENELAFLCPDFSYFATLANAITTDNLEHYKILTDDVTVAEYKDKSVKGIRVDSVEPIEIVFLLEDRTATELEIERIKAAQVANTVAIEDITTLLSDSVKGDE